MITIKQRNTLQKKIISETVSFLHTHPTADEICSEVKKRYPSISKATVYRNLAFLADNGDILKIEVPDSSDCYDFNVKRHSHFKCKECSRIFDIDIPVPEIDLSRNSDKGYTVDGYSLLFTGVCPECNLKKEN